MKQYKQQIDGIWQKFAYTLINTSVRRGSVPIYFTYVRNLFNVVSIQYFENCWNFKIFCKCIDNDKIGVVIVTNYFVFTQCHKGDGGIFIDSCLLLLPLWGSVFFPCFVVQCSVSFLVLQSYCWGRESWLLYFVCLYGVLWLLLFCGFSARCRGVALQCVIVVFPSHTRLLFWKGENLWYKP